MSDSQQTKLEQTKNLFKLVGEVTRLDKDGAFKQDEIQNGQHAGKDYRSLRFGVRTSNENEVTVQMFDMKPDNIFVWNSAKKKEDEDYKGERIDFDDWFENQEKYRKDGYAVLQTRVGLKKDKKGKTESKGLPSYVAQKEIYDNITNGDAVFIEGSIQYRNYEDNQGKIREQKSYNIEKIYLKDNFDLNAESFEEMTFYEQEFVFVDAERDEEEKKVYVTARTIDYKKNFHDTELVVDYADGDKIDKDMSKLGESFLKRFEFGDVLTVFGKINNRAVFKEEEAEEDDEEDLLKALGGKKKPAHASGSVKTYETFMSIEGVSKWEKAKYEEEDFFKDDLVEQDEENNDSGDDLSDDLGGKKKKKNPFDSFEEEDGDFDSFEEEDGDDDAIDISDDDLPF